MMLPLIILSIEDENDREFMAQLFLDHASIMNEVSYKIVKNKSDVEDLVQNALVELIGKINTLRPLNKKQRASYIYNTLVNLNLNHGKKERSKKRKRTPEADAALYYSALSSPEQSPEDSFVSSELYQRLGQALDQLPEKERLALVYKFIFGKSNEEIAKLLGMSQKSIYTYIARAKKKLKIMLEEEGDQTHV